jgi:Tfp pilus assembly protein FimT
METIFQRNLKNNLRAFTLMELVMIIVIMGVLAVSIMPGMFSIKPASIETGAMVLRDEIRYAVDYAINTGNPVRIEFNTTGRTGYSFRTRLADGSWPYLKRPAESTDFNVTFGSGVYKDLVITEANINGTDWIYFNSNGVCLDKNLIPLTFGMNCYIKINNQKNINIEPVSSLVRIGE